MIAVNSIVITAVTTFANLSKEVLNSIPVLIYWYVNMIGKDAAIMQ
jgi:hypothetical protein